MKVGILGFGGSGKTTLFNLLTGLHADVGPGGGHQTNLGIIRVPDPRLDRLAEIYEPKKTTHAEIAFVDAAGQGHDPTSPNLDQTLLSQIRDTEALTLVVRGFPSLMVAGQPNPTRELMDLEGEMVLNDLQVVEKRMHRLGKEGKLHDREAMALGRCKEQLEADRPLRTLGINAEEETLLRGFQFLSQKPAIVVVNTADGSEGLPPELSANCGERGLDALAVCAAIESEVAELDEEERLLFLDEYGIEEPARERFIRAAFAKLDLMCFLTGGPKEVRAWPVKRGVIALRAAGKIHSDLEKGFIRVEVMAFADLDELGSESAVKAAGKHHLHGKEYVVQDGDVCLFRFNV
jgi:GTP-binding protein YchF